MKTKFDNYREIADFMADRCIVLKDIHEDFAGFCPLLIEKGEVLPISSFTSCGVNVEKNGRCIFLSAPDQEFAEYVIRKVRVIRDVYDSGCGNHEPQRIADVGDILNVYNENEFALAVYFEGHGDVPFLFYKADQEVEDITP